MAGNGTIQTEQFRLDIPQQYRESLEALSVPDPDYDLSGEELVSAGLIDTSIFQKQYIIEQASLAEENNGPSGSKAVCVICGDTPIGTIRKKDVSHVQTLLANYELISTEVSITGGIWKKVSVSDNGDPIVAEGENKLSGSITVYFTQKIIPAPQEPVEASSQKASVTAPVSDASKEAASESAAAANNDPVAEGASAGAASGTAGSSFGNPAADGKGVHAAGVYPNGPADPNPAAAPGIYQNTLGGYQSAPGGYQTTPSVYQTAPGVYQTAPGVYQTAPGVYQTAPGVYQTAQGVYQAAPGVYQAAPGVYQAAPGVYQTAQSPSSAPAQDPASAPKPDSAPAPKSNPASETSKASDDDAGWIDTSYVTEIRERNPADYGMTFLFLAAILTTCYLCFALPCWITGRSANFFDQVTIGGLSLKEPVLLFHLITVVIGLVFNIIGVFRPGNLMPALAALMYAMSGLMLPGYLFCTGVQALFCIFAALRKRKGIPGIKYIMLLVVLALLGLEIWQFVKGDILFNPFGEVNIGQTDLDTIDDEPFMDDDIYYMEETDVIDYWDADAEDADDAFWAQFEDESELLFDDEEWEEENNVMDMGTSIVDASDDDDTIPGLPEGPMGAAGLAGISPKS